MQEAGKPAAAAINIAAPAHAPYAGLQAPRGAGRPPKNARAECM